MKDAFNPYSAPSVVVTAKVNPTVQVVNRPLFAWRAYEQRYRFTTTTPAPQMAGIVADFFSKNKDVHLVEGHPQTLVFYRPQGRMPEVKELAHEQRITVSWFVETPEATAVECLYECRSPRPQLFLGPHMLFNEVKRLAVYTVTSVVVLNADPPEMTPLPSDARQLL